MYIEQVNGFGLGNFINITPIIRRLYEEQGRVNVLFRQEYVKQCYIESPYINIIESPIGEKLAGSDLINRGNHMSDSDFAYQHIFKEHRIHDPFIDEVEPMSGEYGVFINGSGSEEQSYLNRKLISFEFQDMVKYHSPVDVIGLGSLKDRDRNIFDGSYGDIRECLRYIKGAKWVISNATGFYHVAGAYKKDQLCLWKDCLRPRNENVNQKCINANQTEWTKKLIDFLQVME